MVAVADNHERDERASDFCLAVGRCHRCGGDHGQVPFAKLRRPIQTLETLFYTHWATCPTTGEPILATLLLGAVNEEERT